MRKKIIKEETIFFGNIQSILNYINDINLDVIDIRLWPQVKTRLVKMVGTLNLCSPYKDRFQLFSSDDKLIQSLLQILEDIANETLTDEKEFDRRAKNFYEDIARAESEKNEPQIDIPLIKTDTDAPEQVERSDQQINGHSEKTPTTDSEKHQTVTNASIDRREKSKQILDNSKDDLLNNVTPPPSTNDNKRISQKGDTNPIKKPNLKENINPTPNNPKKPPLSFKSGLKIALAGVLCVFIIHAYFHNLFGLQTLLKK